MSYKNTKLKVIKTNAAIWLNKLCKIKHPKPKNINIKVNGKKSQDKKTTTNANKYRINQGIKLLYCKKAEPQSKIYRIHLKCAHYCNGRWQHIQNSFNLGLCDVIDTLYKKLNKKTRHANKTYTHLMSHRKVNTHIFRHY